MAQVHGESPGKSSRRKSKATKNMCEISSFRPRVSLIDTLRSTLNLRLRKSPEAPVIACIILAFLPSFALLCYVIVFGVNNIFADEWMLADVFRKLINHTLKPDDLFSQFMEHRPFFPRVVFLLLASLTNYNTVAELFLNWVLLSLTASLILCSHLKCSSSRSFWRMTLALVPAQLLLFNPRQYEAILWGANTALYMMILAVVAAFYFLEVSGKIDASFTLSILSATIASFSHLLGLLVWPVGFFLVLAGRRRSLHRLTSWSIAGTLVTAFYFHGWTMPSESAPLWNSLTKPLAAADFFSRLIGSPFSFDVFWAGIFGDYVARSFGLVIVLIAVIVIIQCYKTGILGKNRFWFALISFCCMSLLVTTAGRNYPGESIDALMFSRYSVTASLGIAALYLLSFSISDRFPKMPNTLRTRFGTNALLAIFLVGLIIPYSMGWSAGGPDWQLKGRMAAYVLRTYDIQSDENINNYVFLRGGSPSDVAYERGLAKFLEQNRLNVFGEQATNSSSLILYHSNTWFAVDAVNGKEASQPHVVSLDRDKTISIVGWAVDMQANDVASTVFITVDGRTDIPALYGLDRQDVAESYSIPGFRYSGYIATFSSSILGEGEHTISLKIVANDGMHYYYEDGVFHILVVDFSIDSASSSTGKTTAAESMFTRST